MNNNQKFVALFLCLFLTFVYKFTVLDPYLYGTKKEPANTPGAPPEAKLPSHPEEEDFSEPSVSERAAEDEVDSDIQPEPRETATEAPPKSKRNPADSYIRESGKLVVDTKVLSVEISLLGGRVTDLYLSHYFSGIERGSPKLNLVEHTEYTPYPLGVYSGDINDIWVQYRVVSAPDEKKHFVLTDAESQKIEIAGNLPDGREIQKVFVFYSDKYLFDVSVQLGAPAADGSRLEVEWTKLISEGSAALLEPFDPPGYVWFDGQKALREAFTALQANLQRLGEVFWVSMGDKYFLVSLISAEKAAPARIIRKGDIYRTRLSGSELAGGFRVFSGPKGYELLRDYGYELHRNINFGRLGFIASPLLVCLHFFYHVFGNYGLAIVALTIVVKFAVYPLTSASFKQMKAMQEIQPEMQRIRETVTDKQQQQTELLALYKKREVNPLGGCLPLLIQMPIFIGLYSALMLAIELRHAPFALWIRDLSSPDRLMLGNVGIPVMVILFVLSMLYQQWTTPSAMDQTQKRVMMIMPIVFGFMFVNFPAGLTLYWLTNNAISICQQKALQKSADKSALFITMAVAAGVFATAFSLVKISELMG